MCQRQFCENLQLQNLCTLKKMRNVEQFKTKKDVIIFHLWIVDTYEKKIILLNKHHLEVQFSVLDIEGHLKI